MLATKLDDAFRSCVWEPSIAYSLVKGTNGLPLAAAGLADALAALMPKAKVDAWLAPLGGDVKAARADPAATLQRVLFEGG